ncbi:MAG TPA: acyl-CoA dehydrogenase family protein [Acidimicrobiales bacterium]|nr:acyl-CoA dehydrogenase family protein [Acidimicrobiales bacterium]
MDFAYGEEHEAVRELAGRIFDEQSTHDRLKAVEEAAGPEGPFDRDLWSALADAGLLGIGLPEDVGGAGLDFLAACLVVEAAGRTAAHVPVVETLAYGAAAVDRFGTAEQRQAWLPRIAGGQAVVTAALAELVGDVVLPGGAAPATTATPDAGGWRLDGAKACVPAGLVADAVLVPATVVADGDHPAGTAVFVVPTDAAGVTRTRQDGPAVPEALLELSGVVVGDDARLGGPEADGAAVVASIAEHATAALCVQEAGVTAASVALISEYTKTREQFGKPIATFQAVGQRAADAYVDAEAIRLTAWQAAWRLSAGLPATAEVAVAKFWAADGGQRVVHAAAHLHGGVGVDRDYPLHRYFLLTRQIELTLGGAHDSLARLGAVLAADPA